MCSHVYVCGFIMSVEVKGQLGRVGSLHHVGPWDRTQVIKVDGKTPPLGVPHQPSIFFWTLDGLGFAKIMRSGSVVDSISVGHKHYSSSKPSMTPWQQRGPLLTLRGSEEAGQGQLGAICHEEGSRNYRLTWGWGKGPWIPVTCPGWSGKGS